MKKMYLKNWVVQMLLLIEFGLFISLSFDNDNLLIFAVSKIAALTLIFAVGILLKAKSHLFDEEE